MTFGAELIGPKRAQRRLWAARAQKVELCLGSGTEDTRHITAYGAKGWFDLESNYCAPGYYRVDGQLRVPDLAYRFQPQDAHGVSEIIDSGAFAWQGSNWRGRPWEEPIIYELHVGSFALQSSFQAVKQRLDYLVDLEITAVELMPAVDFPGTCSWGYDGMLPFAPDSRYGRPEDLKDLVQTTHAKGLMVFLDVVYNHFGLDCNYLHVYAQNFFTHRHRTPWDVTINFDGGNSHTVCDFFIHDALFWLEECYFDGLRLDAVHAITDDADTYILVELGDAVQLGPRKERLVHLVLESYNDAPRYLERDDAGRPRWYTPQWNDDAHLLHTLAMGEHTSYHVDYIDQPIAGLARALTEGFAYQREPRLSRPATARRAETGTCHRVRSSIFGRSTIRWVTAPVASASAHWPSL
jgi:maltooligosyltrehalose trehalohydrolase